MRNFLVLIFCFFTSFSSFCQTKYNKGLNGITLSEDWPPKRSSVSDLENGMGTIPYLDKKDEVLSIKIGRQLFVDNYLIDSTNLSVISHYPEYLTSNPVLKPDKDWENIRTYGSAFSAPFSDGVWYDENEQKFKMWYMAGGGKYSLKNYGITCYAESQDGINWIKPELPIVEGTNIVDFNSERDASVIWYDKQEAETCSRYKMFLVARDSVGKWRYNYKTSEDGIHWKFVCSSQAIADRSTVYKNPFFNKWIFSIRQSIIVSSNKIIRGRVYNENTSPIDGTLYAKSDLKNFWFGSWPNELRHPDFPQISPGVYNQDAIPYESIMLGFFTVWQGPENGYCTENKVIKRNQIMLGYSRDGYHWYRRDMNPFFKVDTSKKSWNNGNVQSIVGSPIIVGDKLFFYASGRYLLDNGEEITSTGLATLRRDGFVSMRAGKEEGFLTTEKLSFDGKYLFVNADVKNKKASLAVEVLDENGNPIEGFTQKECVALKKVDSTKQQIVWKNNKDLSSLAGKNIRLKFYVKNADLYAFWISPWESGESRGYTGGGGPGLSADGIDKPVK